MNRKILLGIVMVLFFFVNLLVFYFRAKPIQSQPVLGPKSADYVEVPSPESVQGPYGMRVCLSPDGEVIAVSGNKAGPPQYYDPVTYSHELNLPRLPYARLFCKRVFVAPSAAHLPDYRPVYDSNRICSILAMALSLGEPRRLAIIARETAEELPASLRSAGVEGVQQLIARMNEQGMRDVLYVVDTDRLLPPRRIATLRENVPLGSVYNDQCVMSVCWTEQPDVLFCYDGEAIIRVSLSGTKKEVYRRRATNHIVSCLTPRCGGLTSFVDYYYVLDPENGGPKELEVPELVSLDTEGVVKKRQELSFFPLFGDEFYNFAIIGETKWAYCEPRPGKANHFLLYVAPISAPEEKSIYYVDCVSVVPCYLRLCAFTPGESEVLLTRKVNLRRYKYYADDILEVPYSQVLKIRL